MSSDLTSKERVSLENGKYEFFMRDGVLQCNRYGEAWRAFPGDKAVHALFSHIVSLSGGDPSEKSACLPADDRGIAEARSSEGGNGGTECASVSIQSREPVGSDTASGGAGELEANDKATSVDPAPIVTADEPSAEQPLCYTIPGRDNADMHGFIPAHIERHGEFTEPLYRRPAEPPAAIPPSTQSKSDAQIAAELQTNMDAMIEPTDERERQCYRRLIRIMARARNRLQQIADAQSTAEPPSAWRPIETAPTLGKWVLLWWPDVTDAAFVGYCVDGQWRAATSGDRWPTLPGPTHWMPLPGGPTVTKDAGECGACDKPGEHCANVHGICSRHGGRAHETSAAPGDDLPQKLRAMRDVPADKLHRSFDAAAKNRGGK